jgi:hypothetical protein
MEIIGTIATAAICCGVLFFLMCAALVFGYLFKQKPQVASTTAPEPIVQSSIASPDAGTPAADPLPWVDPAPVAAPSAAPETPAETTGADG